MVLLILVAVFTFFFPTLNNGFVWDDEYNLLDNPRYRGLSGEHIRWMFTNFYDGNYHPLCWLSLAMDFTLWGMHPAGYHLTNLVLHGLNALLLYLLIAALLRRRSADPAADTAIRIGGALGALFFALHPLRVESVAWISARGDTLCGFFYLLTLLAYLRIDSEGSGQRHMRWLWMSMAFFTASLLSRAWGITLPVILLIMDVYPLRRLNMKTLRDKVSRGVLIEKLPYVLVAFIFGILALQAKTSSMVAVSEHGLLERGLQSFYGLSFYLWKIVVPLDLSPLYQLHGFDPSDLKYSACVLFIVGLTLLLLRMRKQRPWALVTWAVYAIVISPQLGIVQSGPQVVADRYTYFAGMPFAVLAGGGVKTFWQWSTSREDLKIARRAGLASIAILLLLLSSLSYRQTRVWYNSLTFWNRILQIDPDNHLAVNERARLKFMTLGDLAGAEVDYSHALRLNPKNTDALVNRGLVRLDREDYKGAVADFNAADRLDKRQPEVYNGLGLVHYRLGQVAAAMQDFDTAIRLGPEFADAYNNRGLLYNANGNLAAAVKDFDTAIRFNPDLLEAYANRGSIRQMQQNYKQAVRDYATALTLAPESWPHRQQVEANLRYVSSQYKVNVKD